MVTVRRSAVDANFLEVVEETQVIREIEAPFQIRNIPRYFDSIEAVEMWLKKTEKTLARRNAYAHLARRSHSSRGLLQKLKQKRFSEAVCQEILQEVQAQGYLSDEEFYQRAIAREVERGKGTRYIARKLGLDEDTVRKAIPREKQREQIQKLLHKGLSTQALLRRGFCLEEIFEN